MNRLSADQRSRLRDLYARLSDDLDPFRRDCEASGRCCRFAQSDQMLFVTGLEAAYMRCSGERIDGTQLAEGSCPYLREKLCGIRDHRALGCRIYFCDRTGEEDRNAVYEQYLKEIRRMEAEYGMAHTYMPVTKAFSEGSLADEAPVNESIAITGERTNGE